VPWRVVFRRLSLAHGWTPRQIARLTVAQVAACLGEVRLDVGRAMMEPVAARQYVAARRKWREAWIETHLRSSADGRRSMAT
jgi:hypothetical protein